MSISPTPEASAALQALRLERKFGEEEFYPGAPTEAIRLQCEAAVNEFIDDILGILRRGGEKEELFERAKALEESFHDEDTEEREKVGDFIGEAMRALGLENQTDWV